MKKKIILLFLLVVSNLSNAQMTVYATNSKNVLLFFDSPIVKGVVGNNNFTFGYDGENYGILKGISGEPSNLLVTTQNGKIFSFNLQYMEQIEKIQYFISDSLAINLGQSNSKKENIEIEKPEKEMIYIPTKEEYIKKVCAEELENSPFFVRFYNSKSKVYLHLKNVKYVKNELYFSLIIDNKSTLDYDIQDLSFTIIARNKSKKRALQLMDCKPVFIYNKPTRIEGKSQKETIFVFSKFSFNKEKILEISLNEYKGERNIKLSIESKTINNPQLN